MRFKRFNPFAQQSQGPKKIKHIIMMGDSLSDRGTLNKVLLFGCIPMSYLSGLQGHSPDGRFTNGLVWSDHVSAEIASDFTIHRLLKRKRFNNPDKRTQKARTTDDLHIHGYKENRQNIYLDAIDISDAIIMGDSKVLHAIRDSYTLDDDQFVNYRGKVWIRSYCEGGLSSHDYSWNLSTSIVRFFTRLIVSTLTNMRDKLLDYDKKNKISAQQKTETLIIEWSGANDLVTVNAKPSFAEVDKAIAARVDNVKKLIASGYRNFVLLNVPNLALTPRFQLLSKEEQDNAQKCVAYFNAQLQKVCAELNQDYPHCSLDAFDINTMFEHIYNNAKQYGFEESKKTIPYIKSKDFKAPVDGVSPASGYMFYDDIHPSADMHALLAAYFYDQLERRYKLLEPNKEIKRESCLSEDALLKAFRKQYEVRLNADKNSFFHGSRSNLNYKNAELHVVLKHALHDKGARTLDVLKKMGWINHEGQLALDEPVLQHAMDRAHAMKRAYDSLDTLSAHIR
jgi:phospholipase/lecithinase/hemolysin